MSGSWDSMLRWENQNGIERGPEHHAAAEPVADVEIVSSCELQLRPTLTR